MRIPGSQAPADPQVIETLERQVAAWGQQLKPYEVYSRRPSIFHAVVGMWEGLAKSGLLEVPLTALINRRVAGLNGCMF